MKQNKNWTVQNEYFGLNISWATKDQALSDKMHENR